MTKQNIFDNEIFFNEYSKLRKREVNANNLFELPTLYELLPDLKGKRNHKTFEEMDEDEFEEKYNQLDEAHQRQVDQAASNFADGAIGDSSWREGWDCD